MQEVSGVYSPVFQYRLTKKWLCVPGNFPGLSRNRPQGFCKFGKDPEMRKVKISPGKVASGQNMTI